MSIKRLLPLIPLFLGACDPGRISSVDESRRQVETVFRADPQAEYLRNSALPLLDAAFTYAEENPGLKKSRETVEAGRRTVAFFYDAQNDQIIIDDENPSSSLSFIFYLNQKKKTLSIQEVGAGGTYSFPVEESTFENIFSRASSHLPAVAAKGEEGEE